MDRLNRRDVGNRQAGGLTLRLPEGGGLGHGGLGDGGGVLPPDASQREDLASLPRDRPAGAGLGRPVVRVPALRDRPGRDGAADPAATGAPDAAAGSPGRGRVGRRQLARGDSPGAPRTDGARTRAHTRGRDIAARAADSWSAVDRCGVPVHSGVPRVRRSRPGRAGWDRTVVRVRVRPARRDRRGGRIRLRPTASNWSTCRAASSRSPYTVDRSPTSTAATARSAVTSRSTAKSRQGRSGNCTSSARETSRTRPPTEPRSAGRSGRSLC